MERIVSAWSALVLVLLIGLLPVFTGCEGDAGPPGADGVAGTTECLGCHDDDDSEGIVTRANQWANSVHATGGTYERNSSSCSGCHTSEGFLAQMATGTAGSPENPSPVGCFTCHAPHTEGNFSVRYDSPVTHIHEGTVYDQGESNLCANCHQSRATDPPITASTSIDDLRWGPHHGPQSNMFMGVGGYEFTGTSYTNSYHTTGCDNGCIDCHMAAPFGSQAGGHQFGVMYEYHGDEEDLVSGCNVAGCHTSPELEDFDRLAFGDYDGDTVIEPVQDEVDGLMETLRQALLAKGYIDEDDYVVADEDDPLVLTEAAAGALYNFRLVLEDRSRGMHNVDYIVALLQSSIANLP